MDPQLLREQAALENWHWWFVARRRIVDRVVEGLGLPADARILEAGCGTGGNLSMLSRHGEVFAFDVSETARRLGISLAEIEVREPEGAVSVIGRWWRYRGRGMCLSENRRMGRRVAT